jgi:hypothetical protein
MVQITPSLLAHDSDRDGEEYGQRLGTYHLYTHIPYVSDVDLVHFDPSASHGRAHRHHRRHLMDPS